MLTCAPRVSPVLTTLHNLNNFGRGLLDDVTYSAQHKSSRWDKNKLFLLFLKVIIYLSTQPLFFQTKLPSYEAHTHVIAPYVTVYLLLLCFPSSSSLSRVASLGDWDSLPSLFSGPPLVGERLGILLSTEPYNICNKWYKIEYIKYSKHLATNVHQKLRQNKYAHMPLLAKQWFRILNICE